MLYDLRDSLGQVEREKKMKWRKEREKLNTMSVSRRLVDLTHSDLYPATFCLTNNILFFSLSLSYSFSFLFHDFCPFFFFLFLKNFATTFFFKNTNPGNYGYRELMLKLLLCVNDWITLTKKEKGRERKKGREKKKGTKNKPKLDLNH